MEVRWGDDPVGQEEAAGTQQEELQLGTGGVPPAQGDDDSPHHHHRSSRVHPQACGGDQAGWGYRPVPVKAHPAHWDPGSAVVAEGGHGGVDGVDGHAAGPWQVQVSCTAIDDLEVAVDQVTHGDNS